MASGSLDHTALVWDVTGLREDGKWSSRDLRSDELERLWADLAGADSVRAYHGLWRMVAAARESVPFLAERLLPMGMVQNERLMQLIADLDSNQFKVRNRASAQLEELGELTESALRKALAGKPSQEVRQRLEALLDKVEHRALSPKQLRMLRAIEVLEQIATPEAKQVLKSLATGTPEARLTQEANASLERLAKRP